MPSRALAWWPNEYQAPTQLRFAYLGQPRASHFFSIYIVSLCGYSLPVERSSDLTSLWRCHAPSFVFFHLQMTYWLLCYVYIVLDYPWKQRSLGKNTADRDKAALTVASETRWPSSIGITQKGFDGRSPPSKFLSVRSEQPVADGVFENRYQWSVDALSYSSFAPVHAHNSLGLVLGSDQTTACLGRRQKRHQLAVSRRADHCDI